VRKRVFDLHETLSYEAANIAESVELDSASYNSVGKNIDGDPLTPLIEASAGVLVKCPWLNNEVVTLSVAVLTYSENVSLITADNIHIVASLMSDLLANRVNEAEELQEEKVDEAGEEKVEEELPSVDAEEEADPELEPESKEEIIQQKEEAQPGEEKIVQTEDNNRKNHTVDKDSKEQTNQQPVNEKAQPKIAVGHQQQRQAGPVREAKVANPKNSSTPAAKKETAPKVGKSIPARSKPAELMPKSPDRPITNSASVIKEANNVVSEVPPAKNSTSERTAPVQFTAADKGEQKSLGVQASIKGSPAEKKPSVKPKVESALSVEADQQVAAFEAAEADAGANTVAEDIFRLELESDIPKIAEDDGGLEAFVLQAGTEPTSEAEPEGLQGLSFESTDTRDGGDDEFIAKSMEEGENTRELITEEPRPAVLERRIGATMLSDSAEKAVFPVISLDPEEEPIIFRVEEGDSELIFSQQPEVAVDVPEGLAPARIKLPLEKVEKTITQLSEQIEVSEPEKSGSINKSLDKIAEVRAKLGSEGENILTEAEAQEEIKELFAGILDSLGIEHTPELVESLAHLTVKWSLATEIKIPKREETDDEVPQDTGTHEAIMQLLLGLSNATKAMAHAGVLGKSALHLCDFNLAA
jgi:hypothetical protein